MGYYLSKKDKETLVPLIEKMRRSGEDLEIKTLAPDRLVYLLRNALNTELDWKDLKDKWRIVKRDNKVILRIKSIQMNLPFKWIELVAPSFMELATILFQKPEGVRVTMNAFTDTEMFRLRRYCENASYTVTEVPPNLEIKRDD